MRDTSQQFLIASQVLGARVSIQNEYERTLVHLLGDLLSTQAEIDNIQINAINIFNKRDGPEEMAQHLRVCTILTEDPGFQFPLPSLGSSELLVSIALGGSNTSGF